MTHAEKTAFKGCAARWIVLHAERMTPGYFWLSIGGGGPFLETAAAAAVLWCPS